MTKAQKAEQKADRIKMLVDFHAVVVKGKCPSCGTKLYRNNSLAGWWMCGRRGAPGFQKEVGPHCDFQIFYDPTPAEHAAVLNAENFDSMANMPGYREWTR